MSKKQKTDLIRILVAFGSMIGLYLADPKGWIAFFLYLIPYLIVGHDILRKAMKGIVNRQPLDENLLMSIATLGAFALAIYRTGDYLEAVAVMLFYQVGELFQSYALGKSRRNIGQLMDIRPDIANLEGPDGVEEVDPEDVEVGSIILVRPGEKVPIDGTVVSGSATVDTSALTGESLPREVSEGDEILSGSINNNGVLRIKTDRDFDESTASKILDLVENASSRKARSEKFISRFARVYTPIVVISAVILAIAPPLIRMLIMGTSPEWGDWVYRALTFLVISCPCALVISIPLGFFAGIGGASRKGILVKGSNFLETLSKIRTVVMDKTGTLTKGVFQVTGIYPATGSLGKDELIHLAARCERYSGHPIAMALKKAAGFEDDREDADRERSGEEVEEISGQGIISLIDGSRILVGNRTLLENNGIKVSGQVERENGAETLVYVGRDDSFAGYITIRDALKDGAFEAIRGLERSGIKKTVMLTGDDPAVGKTVAEELGMGEVYGGLLPSDKVDMIEKIMEEPGLVAFVGDGINDAPVLSRADVGIAMGALGSDAAIEAADVVLMDDDPAKISEAIRISRKCMRIVKENITLAIGIKVICLLLCALGIAGMWLAIFADVGVMIIAVLNAVRALF